MKKRVLLVDTNFSSVPIYEYLTNRGFEVAVCGGNPLDVMAKSMKDYICIDYSDRKKMRELVNSNRFDYIVPGCNDVSYRVCSEICDVGRFVGLDTPETTDTINNKGLFRDFAKRCGIPVPRATSTSQSPQRWPVIVKPVDAYSGRGITVVAHDNTDSLPDAVRFAESVSQTGTCVVEEYVEGQLLSHSAFYENGRIVFDFVVEEHGSAYPFAVDTSRVDFEFPRETLRAIRETVLTIAAKLDLVDGLIHSQFIKGNEECSLIEITRRCPGDLYSYLIEGSTGFPYVEAYTKPYLGESVSSVEWTPATRLLFRHTLSSASEGNFGSVSFRVPIEIERCVPLASSGDKIGIGPNGRIAVMFIRANSADEFSRLYLTALQRELYTIVLT
jgi:biotin carboxylase